MEQKKTQFELYHPGLTGCSDGGCIIRLPKGMHTNGGCRCQKALMRTKEGRDAVRTIMFLRKQTIDMNNQGESNN